MKKTIATIALASMMAMGILGGCAGTPAIEGSSGQPAQAEVKAEPLNLDGTWKSVNNTSEDSWQEATIDGDIITINWVSDNGDTKSLYWADTVVEPTDETIDETYTWDSTNDTGQTSKALLASGDETKTFTYSNGQISYEVSAMGTTKTVHMERV